MALISVIKMYFFGTMLNRQFGKTHHVILGYQVSFRLLSKENTTIKSKGKTSFLNNAINLFHFPHSPYHTQPNTPISPLHPFPPSQQPPPRRIHLPRSITQPPLHQPVPHRLPPNILPLRRPPPEALAQTHRQPIRVQLVLLLDIRKRTGAVRRLVNAGERAGAEVFAAGCYFMTRP